MSEAVQHYQRQIMLVNQGSEHNGDLEFLIGTVIFVDDDQTITSVLGTNQHFERPAFSWPRGEQAPLSLGETRCGCCSLF